MKPLTLLLSLAALFAGTVSAAEVSIPILNATFDLDQLQCSPGYNCAYPGISGWLCGPETSVQKMSTAQYPAAPPEGIYVAAIGYSTLTGSILQTLADTVQAKTTYVLKLKIGARADLPFTGYSAGLMAGNVVVAPGNNSTPVGGTFITDEIIYVSGPAPAQLGKPLQIFVKSLGTGQVDVAAVTLTAITN